MDADTFFGAYVTRWSRLCPGDTFISLGRTEGVGGKEVEVRGMLYVSITCDTHFLFKASYD